MDKISRIHCKKLNLRAYTVESLSTAREIVKIHETTPNATVAMGNAINAAALLAATLKPKSRQSLLLKFSGEGPLREVHAQADANGNIRAYTANPAIDECGDFNSINFSKAIGAGLITVIKDLGMKENYKSVTPILKGEIAADLAYYLTTSEQIPSAVLLGLNLNSQGEIIASGGILIQTFPDTDSRVIEQVEFNINNLDTNLGESLAQGKDINSVLSNIFGGEESETLTTIELKHGCSCGRESLLGAMKNIDPGEIKSMIEEDGGAEITCTFCKKNYNFSADDLKGILPQIH